MLGIEPRPRVEPDMSNFDEVFEWFRAHGPNRHFLRGFHRTTHALCEPFIVFAPGAQDEIVSHSQTDAPTALVFTHHTALDPANMASAMWDERETFDPIMGETVVLSKPDNFNLPVLGTIISWGGAKPAFTEKDLRRDLARKGFDKATIERRAIALRDQRQASNGQMQNLEVAMVDRGYTPASFLEGIRTKDHSDYPRLQKLQNGMKYLMRDMERSDELKIICAGFSYRGTWWLPKRFLSPTIYIDIIDAPPLEEVNEVLAMTLQDCLDQASDWSERRPKHLTRLNKLGLASAAVGSLAVARKLRKAA